MTSDLRHSGFTLLEMLVVLLIGGMALALVSQSLSQYKQAQDRVSDSSRRGREYRQTERWFRDAVAGLQAVDPETLGIERQRDPTGYDFRGDAQRFSGRTRSSITAGPGIPMDQSWAIISGPSGDALVVEENNLRLELPMPNTGMQFHYLDPAGHVHAQWPPANGPSTPLPAAIVLDRGLAGPLAAAVMGPLVPRTIPYEPDPL